jgi:hypothetical protein
VASLHGRNACVVSVLLLAAAPFGARALASVALGGAIAAVNLRLLERSVARLLGRAAQPSSLGLRLVLHVRMGLLFGVVAAALLSRRVDPIPFTVGMSSFVAAVLWHGWRSRET